MMEDSASCGLTHTARTSRSRTAYPHVMYRWILIVCAPNIYSMNVIERPRSAGNIIRSGGALMYGNPCVLFPKSHNPSISFSRPSPRRAIQI